MEAILVPSALVPGRGATWEAVDEGSARFRMMVGDGEFRFFGATLDRGSSR